MVEVETNDLLNTVKQSVHKLSIRQAGFAATQATQAIRIAGIAARLGRADVAENLVDVAQGDLNLVIKLTDLANRTRLE